MPLHPKIENLPKVKYRRLYSKLLKGIDKDFNSLGIEDYEIEINALKKSGSYLYHLFMGHGFKNPVEAMTIRTEFHNCPSEIILCMGRSGIKMPYFMFVDFLISINGRAAKIWIARE